MEENKTLFRQRLISFKPLTSRQKYKTGVPSKNPTNKGVRRFRMKGKRFAAGKIPKIKPLKLLFFLVGNEFRIFEKVYNVVFYKKRFRKINSETFFYAAKLNTIPTTAESAINATGCTLLNFF